MSASDSRTHRSGAAAQAAMTAAQHSPVDHAPIWRSVAALADSLNAGSRTPTFTTHSIRHYVRFAEQNGLKPHVRRLGTKILIDETGFRAWIDAQGQRAA